MSTTAPDKTKLMAERAEQARKVITAAQRKARRVAADQEVNRSTRGRNALKVKADALDHVTEILAGKPGPAK